MCRMLILLLIAALLCGCAAGETAVTAVAEPETTASAATEPAPTEPVRSFRVEGTELLDPGGNPFLIRGVNHPHRWFPEQDETALRAMAELGCNTVRIVCGCGILYEKDTVESLNALTDLCKELGMVAILEVHDITCEDHPDKLAQVVDYWIEVREALIGREEWVILNIANEWKGQRWGREWSRAYCAQIPRLREAGIRNAILVDTAGGCQYGESLMEFGPAVLDADPERNTFFAVHLYQAAGRDPATIEKNLRSGRDAGLCVLVGEFGPSHQGHDVDEAYILEYCHREGIGYLGWSWAGNASPNEQLDLSLTWDGSKLTQWGEFLFFSEFGIRQTSKDCITFASFSNIG